VRANRPLTSPDGRPVRTPAGLKFAGVVLLLACAAVGCATGSTAGGRSASPAVSQPTAKPSPIWLQSLQMVSPRTGWALRWTGNPAGPGNPTLAVARSTDGGRIWTDVTPPAAGPLITPDRSYDVLMAESASRAWFAVTLVRSESSYGVTPHRTEVFGTANGGRSWTSSAPIRAPGTARWLDFTDPAHGWLMQDLGAAMQQSHVQLYRTSDGGRHWALIAQTLPWPRTGTSGSGLPVYCDKTGIAFTTAQTGWLTGGCNSLSDALLVSHDGGLRWAPQALPIPAGPCQRNGCAVSAPRFFGPTGFLTVGGYPGTGHLLASHDAGATWTTVPLPAAARSNPAFLAFDARRGILIPIGPQGVIGRTFYATSDGGRSWTQVRQGMPFRKLGMSVEFVSPAAGFAWIQGGDATGPAPIYATTNGGRTWNSFVPLG